MLSASDLLNRSWSDLCQMDEFRVAAWKGLGEEEPWEHADVPSYDQYQERIIVCRKCKALCRINRNRFCPVPPQIDMPPEVVAERLLRAVEKIGGPALLTRIVFNMGATTDIEDDVEAFSLWLHASPTQRIVVCLLALGLIEP